MSRPLPLVPGPDHPVRRSYTVVGRLAQDYYNVFMNDPTQGLAAIRKYTKDMQRPPSQANDSVARRYVLSCFNFGASDTVRDREFLPLLNRDTPTHLANSYANTHIFHNRPLHPDVLNALHRATQAYVKDGYRLSELNTGNADAFYEHLLRHYVQDHERGVLTALTRPSGYIEHIGQGNQPPVVLSHGSATASNAAVGPEQQMQQSAQRNDKRSAPDGWQQPAAKHVPPTVPTMPMQPAPFMPMASPWHTTEQPLSVEELLARMPEHDPFAGVQLHYSPDGTRIRLIPANLVAPTLTAQHMTNDIVQGDMAPMPTMAAGTVDLPAGWPSPGEMAAFTSPPLQHAAPQAPNPMLAMPATQQTHP